MNSSLTVGVNDVTDETYFAHPALSQSGAKLLLPPSCPALFKWQQDHPRPEKKAFDFGHAAHAKLLGVGQPIVVIPDELLASNGAVSTKAAKEFVAEARANGQVPLKTDEAAQVDAMMGALQANPEVMRLFTAGRPERALLWLDTATGVELRGKLDWLADDGSLITDYKTAESASPWSFGRRYIDYGYHQQAAWYTDAVKALGLHDDPEFVFVVQQKTAPYLVQPYRLSPAAINAGRELNRRAIDIYAECSETGVWPGFSDRVETVDLPAWYAAPEQDLVEAEWFQ